MPPRNQNPAATNNDEVANADPVQIGKQVFIRTVTMYHTGVIVAIKEGPFPRIVLDQACWIADAGRFHDALSKGPDVFNEVEPFVGTVAVSTNSIVDVTEWKHPLPYKQK